MTSPSVPNAHSPGTPVCHPNDACTPAVQEVPTALKASDSEYVELHAASLLDRETVLQQEATGILGVNLIHAALYGTGPGEMIKELLDDLSSERLEVDLIEFSGPAFAGVDNRLMSLELVHCGLSKAAMFTPSGTYLP